MVVECGAAAYQARARLPGGMVPSLRMRIMHPESLAVTCALFVYPPLGLDAAQQVMRVMRVIVETKIKRSNIVTFVTASEIQQTIRAKRQATTVMMLLTSDTNIRDV